MRSLCLVLALLLCTAQVEARKKTKTSHYTWDWDDPANYQVPDETVYVGRRPGSLMAARDASEIAHFNQDDEFMAQLEHAALQEQANHAAESVVGRAVHTEQLVARAQDNMRERRLAGSHSSCKRPDVFKIEVALLVAPANGHIVVCSTTDYTNGLGAGSYYQVNKPGVTITGQRRSPRDPLPLIVNSGFRVLREHITIENLRFWSNISSPNFGVFVKTDATGADHLTVSDSIFRGGVSGVQLRGTRFSSVHDCMFENINVTAGSNGFGYGVAIQGSGLVGELGTMFNDVYNNKFVDFANPLLNVGVLLSDSTRQFDGSEDSGSQMFGRVRGNIFRNVGLAAVFVTNSVDGYLAFNEITENIIGAVDVAVLLQSGSSVLVERNKIFTSVQGIIMGRSFTAAVATQPSVNNVIRNNDLRNLTASGIQLQNNAVGNIVEDNDGGVLCDNSLPNTNIIRSSNKFVSTICQK